MSFTKTFRIEPISKDRVPTPFQLNYHLGNGKMRYMTFWSGVSVSDESVSREKTPGSAHEELVFSLRKDNPKMFYEFSYEVDEKTEKAIPESDDAKLEDFIARGLCNSPLVLFNMQDEKDSLGRPRTNPIVDAVFNLVDITAQQNEKLIDFKDKHKAKNAILEMSFEKKRNVCFYFGESTISPETSIKNGKVIKREMTSDELDLFLCEGDLIFGSAKKFEDFKEVFMDGSVDKTFEININKAILYKIITKQEENGSVNYFLGATLLGSTVLDVQSYLTREHELYENHIIPQIENREETIFIPKVVKNSAKQMNEQAKVTPTDKEAEVKKMREEIKQMTSDGLITPELLKTLKGVTLTQGFFLQGKAPYEELVIVYNAGKKAHVAA